MTAEQFTDGAHYLMVRANSEAIRFNQKNLRKEHILLAITKMDKTIAAKVLGRLNVDLVKARSEIEDSMDSGPDNALKGKLPMTPGVKLPMTPGVKNVFEYAMEEAQNLNHQYVGTQHILLGLLREQPDVPAVWKTLGVSLEGTRVMVSKVGEDGERPIVT